MAENRTAFSGPDPRLIGRRRFLRMAGMASVLAAGPAWAVDLFKMIDPEGKNKNLQKAKGLLEGTSSIIASSTEIDYNTEFSIGESLALEGFKRYGEPVDSKDFQEYVDVVGNAVARNSIRPEIPYYFVVVESPLYNAFSCPGGIIFVSAALVRNMADEAQLACVLAHEVAHVGHKHALSAIKRAKFFEGVGKISDVTMKGEQGAQFRNMIGSLQTVLFDKGLDKEMEYQADLSGMETAYRTGYDPAAFVGVLEMLRDREDTATIGGSWFSTHPPLSSRLSRCREQMRQYPDAANLARVPTRFDKYKAMI